MTIMKEQTNGSISYLSDFVVKSQRSLST